MANNQRQTERVNLNLPIQISFGSQITLQGQLRDISSKSAFIKIKASIFMQPNDELNFEIQPSANGPDGCIQGAARISRIAVGEGIAIYFVKMEEESSRLLQQLVQK